MKNLTINKSKQNEDAVVIIATLEGEDWKKIQDNVSQNAKKNISTSGFRPGKAPDSMANPKMDKNQLLRMSINEGIKKIINHLETQKNTKRPEGNDALTKVISADTNRLSLEITYFPRTEVNIDFLKKIEITVPKRPRINDPEVEKGILNLLKSRAKRNEVERPIKNGDVANFDFAGTLKDGTPFEGGSANNFNLEIGSKQFIPGFEEKMVGLKKDQETVIKVKFPKNYYVKTLADQEVQFKLKIHHVYELELPKVDNDFIQSLNDPNVKNPADLRGAITNALVRKSIQDWQQHINNLVIEQIVKHSNVIVNAKILESEFAVTSRSFHENALRSNMDPEGFARANNLDPKNYKDQLKKITENRIILSLVLREYKLENKVEIAEKEIKDAFGEYRKNVAAANTEVAVSNYDEFKSRYINDRILFLITDEVLKRSQKTKPSAAKKTEKKQPSKKAK